MNSSIRVEYQQSRIRANDMKFLNINNPINEQIVKDFESKLNTSLPLAYRNFLLQFNGGEPEPNLFKKNVELGYLVVNELYGINAREKSNNLEHMLEIYDGRISNNFIAIGGDPGGNQFCIGILGSFAKKIFFWDHEEEVDEDDFVDNVLPENMYFLADDFDIFINQLTEDD